MGEKRAHILLAEDDQLFRESVARNLSDAGYKITAFGAAEDMVDAINDGLESDLMILDWGLPGISGVEALRALREKGVETPAIVLTALGDQLYEEAALIAGAVDFVEKSRSFSILLRRIELALHRGSSGEGAAPANDQIGSLLLQPEISRLTWNGLSVDLTLTEYRIVEFMARRAGRDVRYRDIYDVVKGEGFVAGIGQEGYRANVRAFIKRLRQKFRDVDADFEAIENYPGFGYRWREGA